MILFFKQKTMSIIKPGEGKEPEQKRIFLNKVKKFSQKLGDFLSWRSYHDDEMGVDTRNQGDRYLQKTWEMYHLEQKRNKEEAEKYRKKLEELVAEDKENLK